MTAQFINVRPDQPRGPQSPAATTTTTELGARLRDRPRAEPGEGDRDQRHAGKPRRDVRVRCPAATADGEHARVIEREPARTSWWRSCSKAARKTARRCAASTTSARTRSRRRGAGQRAVPPAATSSEMQICPIGAARGNSAGLPVAGTCPTCRSAARSPTPAGAACSTWPGGATGTSRHSEHVAGLCLEAVRRTRARCTASAPPSGS